MGSDARGIRAGRAFVEVGADKTPLEKELAAAADKLKAWGAAIAAIGASMGVAGAMLADGLLLATNQFRETTHEIYTANQLTGIAAERLGAMSYAAVQLGGSMEDVTRGMVHMTRFLREVRDRSGSALDTLARLGVTVQELQGLNLEQTYYRLGSATAAVGDSTERLMLAMQILGRHGINTMNVFGAGSERFAALMREAVASGQVLSRADVEAGENLNRLWGRMEMSLKSLKNQIGAGMVEPWTWLLNAIIGTTDAATKLVRQFRDVIPWLDKLATGLTIGGGAFVALGIALGAASMLLRQFSPLVSAAQAALSMLGSAASTAAAAVGPALSWIVTQLGVAANAAMAAGSAMAGAMASAAAWVGSALYGMVAGPIAALIGAFFWVGSIPVAAASNLIGSMSAAASAVMGAAVAIVSSIVGGIGPAFSFMAAVIAAPITAIGALIGAMTAGGTAMVSGAGANAVFTASATAAGISEATVASVSATTAGVIGILVAVINAATAAHAAGATASGIFAAALTGLGLSADIATFAVTILTTAWAMYTGASTVYAGVSALVNASLLAMGLSADSAATATTFLMGAGALLWGVLTGGISIVSAFTGLLTLMGLGQATVSADTAGAAGVWGSFAGALAFTGAAAANAFAWISGLGISQIALKAITALGTIIMGLFSGSIAWTTVVTLLAEAATGVWMISLAALAAVVAFVVVGLAWLWFWMVTIAAVGAVMAVPIIVGFVALLAVIVGIGYLIWKALVWTSNQVAWAAGVAWDWIKDKAMHVWYFLVGAFDKLAAVAAGVWESIRSAAGSAFDWLRAQWDGLMAFGQRLGEVFGSIFASMGFGQVEEAMAVGLAAIKLAWLVTIGFLEEQWLGWRNAILDTTEGAWLRLRELWHSGAFSLRNIWRLLGEAVGTSWTAVTTFLRARWQDVVDFITGSHAAGQIHLQATQAQQASEAASGEVQNAFNPEEERRQHDANVAARARELAEARGGNAASIAQAQANLDHALQEAMIARQQARLQQLAGLGASAANTDERTGATGWLPSSALSGSFSAQALAGAFAGDRQERQLAEARLTNEQLTELIRTVALLNVGGVVFR